MKKSDYQIQVQNDGIQNTLILELSDDAEPISYCLKLMETTKVPGLLPVHWQFFNGRTRFSYPVSGKTPLEKIVSRNDFSYDTGITILKNLTNSLSSLHEYLIMPGKLYLDADYLYIGNGLQAYLPFVPVQENVCDDFADDLKQFYQAIVNEFQKKGIREFYEMFIWIYNQSSFDLTSFEERFLKKGRESAGADAPIPEVRRSAVGAGHEGAVPGRQDASGVRNGSDRQGISDYDNVPVPRKVTESAGIAQEQSVPKPEAAPAGGGAADSERSGKKAERSGLLGGLFRKKKEPEQEEHAVRQPAGGRGFSVPGASGAAVSNVKQGGDGKQIMIPGKGEYGVMQASAPAMPQAEQEEKRRHGRKLFGREKKSEAADASAQQAVRPPVPERREPAVPQGKPAIPRQESGEAAWESGTIFIDENGMESGNAGDSELTGGLGGDAMPRAYIQHGGQVRLIDHSPFTLGRGLKERRLDMILDNSRVSHHHASICFENGRFVLRDENSTNGTSVNHRDIGKGGSAVLNNGDSFALYDEEFSFVLG